MVFNHKLIIRNRKCFNSWNTFLNNLISSKFSICIAFTKRTIIKESSKINLSIICKVSNIIKNILSLFTFSINIILIKFSNKLFWVWHYFLRIYTFRRLTLTLSLFYSFFILTFKLLLKRLLCCLHYFLF